MLELLGPGGRFVMYGWGPGGQPTELRALDLFARGLTVTAAVGPHIMRRPGGLRALEERALDAAASGSVAPSIEAFPLSEAAAAHRAIEERRTAGKVVLIP